MKKSFLLSIAFSFAFFMFASSVQAQKGLLKLNVHYNYSTPVGAFQSDMVSNGSPRGFGGDILYNITNEFSVGLSGGYQDYYQKYARAIYEAGSGQHVSAVISNSIQTSPIIAKAKYMPSLKSFVLPFVNVGAGISIVDNQQYLGEFGSSETSVSFMAQGGVGAYIPFTKSKKYGFQLGANFNLVPYTKFGYDNLNSFNFFAGISIPIEER